MKGQLNTSRSDGNLSEVQCWLEQSLRRYPPFDMKLRRPRSILYGTIAVPRFTGLPDECPKLFFSRSTKYVAQSEISDEETVQLLGCVLQKRAHEIFNEIITEFRKREEVCDFNKIKGRILNYFTDKKLDFVNWNALHNRKLRLHEKIRTYYDDLRHLNSKFIKPLDDLLNIFISGLPNSFKFHVLFQYPVDVLEAVKIAKEYKNVTNYFGEVNAKEINVSVNAIPKKSSSKIKEIQELQDQLQNIRDELEHFRVINFLVILLLKMGLYVLSLKVQRYVIIMK